MTTIAPMNDRAITIASKRIAREMRARVEIVAEHLGTVETLAGLCHFAALGVTQAMCSAGLPAFIASDGGHSWTEVELSTGLMLVDVTASQFGFTDVLIRMPGKPRPTVDRTPIREEERGRRRRQYRRPMYLRAVSALEAQRMCSGVAGMAVARAPHDWFVVPVDELADLLAWEGTALAPAGRLIARRTAAAPRSNAA
jgi:hypothetical protein